MFDESARKIFRYEAQGQVRCADPLELRRQLLRATGGRFYTLWGESEEPAPPAEGAEEPPLALADRTAKLMAALEAQAQLVEAARSVFGLPAVGEDGGGVPEEDVLAVLDAYAGWLEKNARRGES